MTSVGDGGPGAWLGTSGDGVHTLPPHAGRDGRDQGSTKVAEATAPTFLAVHPHRDRLYALAERDPGAVLTLRTDPSSAAAPVAEPVSSVPSGGSGPCHLLVHPEGRWLYVAHYGDGTFSALELDAAGDPTGVLVTHLHDGSGSDPDRQEGPHAHSTTLAPGGRHAIVADLGTDELRAYPLRDGRPEGPAELTPMPPGCGPRHLAVIGDLLHVAGELSGDVVTLRWDAAAGRGEVVAVTRAVTRSPRTGDLHALSHIEAVGEHLLVGVRGADTVAVLRLGADGLPVLVDEVLTATWPRHLAVDADAVLVAGERADVVAVHPFQAGAEHPLGEVAATIAAPSPMCLLPIPGRSD